MFLSLIWMVELVDYMVCFFHWIVKEINQCSYITSGYNQLKTYRNLMISSVSHRIFFDFYHLCYRNYIGMPIWIPQIKIVSYGISNVDKIYQMINKLKVLNYICRRRNMQSNRFPTQPFVKQNKTLRSHVSFFLRYNVSVSSGL